MRKEVKGMTNYEKFKNEIEALDYDFGVTKTQEICFCQTVECDDCVFSAELKRNSCVPAKVRWLYEEAKEIFPITIQEKHFLEVLKGSSYIARDCDDRLFIYSQKPVQLSNCWFLDYAHKDDNVFEICPDFFEFITWESNKCWSVAELLRLPIKE